MLLMKRCTLAIMLSFMSEGAIAQTPAPEVAAMAPALPVPGAWTINTQEFQIFGGEEALFVLGIPRMVGTVQMVINPVPIS